MRTWLICLTLASTLLNGCRNGAAGVQEARAAAPDIGRLMADLRALAADSMEGRRAGSEGGARARRYLLAALPRAGVQPLGSGFERPFAFRGPDSVEIRGVNLIGVVPGRRAGPYLVLTAHYDHVGVRDGEIYNGADDNASGTAAVLEVARHLAGRRPEYPTLVALLDAEEMGLRGARAFVENPPVPREAIALNVNLDMVGRNVRGELFAAGTHHWPAVRPHLERVAASAPINLRFGHDSPDLPAGQDWTNQSDHGVFHAAGVPFVYFGVEDHPDYHRPTDDVERIEPGFFAGAVTTILHAVTELNQHLPTLRAGARVE